jgi:hypothetical protein
MLIQNVMNEYFNEVNENKNLIPNINYGYNNPVKPKNSNWNIDEKHAKIVYTFKSRKIREAFVIEMMKYIREAECEIEVTLKNKKVKISIYPLSPSMSEIEYEAISNIKKIKKDVSYYFAKKD